MKFEVMTYRIDNAPTNCATLSGNFGKNNFTELCIILLLISVEGASEYGSVPQQSASTRSKNLTRFNLATKIVYSGVIIYAVRLYQGRGMGVPMAISWMFTINIKQLRLGNWTPCSPLICQ